MELTYANGGAQNSIEISEDVSDDSNYAPTKVRCKGQSVELQRGEEEEKEGQTLIYGVDDVPPWYSCFVFGLQQLLLSVGGFITFPLVMMSVLCADNSIAVTSSKSMMIGTSLFTAGFATFIQTTLGLRLGVLQGLTAAYFIPALAILSTDEWKCPAALDLNSTLPLANMSISYDVNNTAIIHDHLNNATITTDPESYYYRDNDGAIRDSNGVWLRRMLEIQGAVTVSACLQLIIGTGGVMGFLMRFIGPLTIAPTLVLIAYAITDTAMGLAQNQWGITILVIAIFFISSICLHNVKIPIPVANCRKRRVSITRQPLFSMFPILIAIAIGWIVCYIITAAGGFSDDPADPSYNARTDTQPGAVENTPWFRFPYPCQWGLPTLTISSVFGMMAAVLPGILESIGDYNGGAIMSKEPPPPRHAINRAVVMEGFGILTAGLLGTGNATTSYSANMVVIGISRVASRRVFQWTGAMLMILGIFTKFCSIFVSLPGVILGGTMMATTGMILAIGVSTLKHVDMTTSRNLFIFGFSVFFGIVVTMYANKYPERLDVGVPELTNIILVLLRTPMFVGGLVGFCLDNIAPGTYESRGLGAFVNEQKPDSAEVSLAAYDLPFKTDCAWTRWIPICPKFRTSQGR